jgi:hypothetical protein
VIGNSRTERPGELATARAVTVHIQRTRRTVSRARLHWTARPHDREKGTKP